MGTPSPVPSSKPSLRRNTDQIIAIADAADAHKAWHMVAVLLSLGRPVRPSELASECTLFYSTPDFIHFLCSIPNSPLRLVKQYVTISQTGRAVIQQFLANRGVIVTFLDSPEFVPPLLEYVRSNNIMRTCSRKRKRLNLEIDFLPLTEKKRCLHNFNEETIQDDTVLTIGDGILNAYPQLVGKFTSRGTEWSPLSSVFAFDFKNEKAIFASSMLTHSRQLDCKSENVQCGYSEMECEDLFSHGGFVHLLEHIAEEKRTEGNSESEVSKDDDKEDNVNLIIDSNNRTSSCLGVEENVKLLQSENETIAQACTLLTDVHGEHVEVFLHDFDRSHVENLPIDVANTEKYHIDDPCMIVAEANNVVGLAYMPWTEVRQQNQGDMLKQPADFSTPKADKQDATHHGNRAKWQTMDSDNCIGRHTEPQPLKRDKKPNLVKQKTKRNCDQVINTQGKAGTITGNRKGASSNSTIKETAQKNFPEFESFIVEEEEGSGGYGTVYRARRKSDGIVFAIKSPHVNANKNHVHNELKMLQRLGGKNFVIKYEGSIKKGKSDCLVLEHVKHDKPEVLKKKINILQLQWYGYCMFKALAGLHKLGIVHRDVKPGNFLFSLTGNKGYLIDFNLALDLHKKYGAFDNSKSGNNVNFGQTPPVRTKSLPPAKDKKLTVNKFPEAVNHNQGKGQKSLLPPGSLKRIKNHGADGSTITSVKDSTSNRTPSVERLREPLPSQGRKEYLSFVQESLNGGVRESVNAPISKRKRVAAPPQTTGNKFYYPTPMPLHAGGVAIGTGPLKSNGKHKQEGPCVGTKGFRAPEVLFRSQHQGPKVDIWSAGVTLLYLMVGKPPFNGDPDQNIKEIAKLRGTEDLWEVAKLHDHETLFPSELFDVQHLSPVKLRDWCAQNTKRRDFLELIPRSLFDLVDKCLTVNPRLRISAEEALRHEFFAPCHDELRKKRLRRQGLSLDSGTSILQMQGEESQPCEVNSF